MLLEKVEVRGEFETSSLALLFVLHKSRAPAAFVGCERRAAAINAASVRRTALMDVTSAHRYRIFLAGVTGNPGRAAKTPKLFSHGPVSR